MMQVQTVEVHAYQSIHGNQTVGDIANTLVYDEYIVNPKCECAFRKSPCCNLRIKKIHV
jgi:hypothetical protein